MLQDVSIKKAQRKLRHLIQQHHLAEVSRFLGVSAFLFLSDKLAAPLAIEAILQ